MAEQCSDDEEKYVPAGLANYETGGMKADLIEEFYKPVITSTEEVLHNSKVESTEKLIDLSSSTSKPQRVLPKLLESPIIPPIPTTQPSPISPSPVLRPLSSPIMYQRPPINYAMSQMPYSVPMAYSMPHRPILPIWPGYIMMPVPPHCYPVVPQLVPVNIMPPTPPPIPERASPQEIDVETISETSLMDDRKSKMTPLKKRKLNKDEKEREYQRPEKLELRKDVFLIRLKDVDSFDRSNEIWRIDNNILIQKFTGVPSLRAPARQFQSTNRMCGYDRRADWRFYIIDSHNVEFDRFSHEITVHRFPTLDVLRKAKALAEKMDETFKDTEMTEYREKLLEMEKKKDDRKKEKTRRKMERIQKRMEKNKMRFDVNSNYDDNLNVNRSKYSYKWSKKSYKKQDEEIFEVCQDVLEMMVDQVVMHFDEIVDSDESDYSDEDLEGYDCTDDEDGEQEELYPLFDPDDIPEVGLEMTIASVSSPY